MSEPFISPLLISPGVGDSRSRDFVAALSDVLGSFSTKSLLVQDPLTVDARLLPILTIELGMTEFMTPGLRETHVRELLARAPEIHAWTGTVYGTRRALGALGVTVDWMQWWQQEPKGLHDTHTVVAYVNAHVIDGEDNLFSAATQYAVRRVIEATKRWSQEINFLLGVKYESRAGLAGAVSNAACVDPTATAAAPMPLAKIGVFAAAQHFAGARHSAEVTPPALKPAGFVAAASLINISCIRAVMTVLVPPAALEPPPVGSSLVVDTRTGLKLVVDRFSRYLTTKVSP